MTKAKSEPAAASSPKASPIKKVNPIKTILNKPLQKKSTPTVTSKKENSSKLDPKLKSIISILIQFDNSIIE